MFDLRLRTVKERWLDPLVRVVARIASATTLTTLSLVAGLASALTLAAGSPLWVPFVLGVLNRLLDGIDGEVARVRGEQSDFGGYADMLADVVTYAAVPIGLALRMNDPAVTFAMLGMLAAFYINITSWSYLSALLEKRKQAPGNERTSVSMPRGVIEGAETMVLYAVLILAPAAVVTAAWIAVAACGVNVVWRLVWARRVLRDKEAAE